MSTIIFPCGCQFPVNDNRNDTIEQDPMDIMPLGIQVDMFNIPLDCPATWHMLSEGRTKGVFQLEGQLGRTWAKKVKPGNLEALGALVALLRPGCLKAVSLPYVEFPNDTSLQLEDQFGQPFDKMFLAGERYELEKHTKKRNSEQITLEFSDGKVVVHQDDCIIHPAKSMTEHYADRKNRLEDVDYFGIKELESVLGNTYGVLVYQEQAMKISVVLAGFNPQQADILRKAIGKKKADIMWQVRGDFINGCVITAIVTREQAEMIFGLIQESQRYSFNKSHAISYGMGSYWSAYCKAHGPVQFFCSYLRGAEWKQDSYEEIRQLVADAQSMEVRVRVPDFRDLKSDFNIKGREIFFGLSSIRGIGGVALDKIKRNAIEIQRVLDKDLYQWSWLDYLLYFSPRVSSTVNKSLILSGALDFLNVDRKVMMHEFENWLALTAKEQEWFYDKLYENFTLTNPVYTSFGDMMIDAARPKKEGGACANKNRVSKLESLYSIMISPPASMNDTPHFIAINEERYLGLPLTCTEIDGLVGASDADAKCIDILNEFGGQVSLAVIINRVKEIKTKKDGKPMAFLTVSDSSGALEDVVCFTDQWLEHSDKLHLGNNVLILGQRDAERGGFIIRNVWQI